MEKLFKSAIKHGKRTPVTTLFVQNGFRIAMTDFNDVIFEKGDTKVNAHFDLNSNLKSVVVLQK